MKVAGGNIQVYKEILHFQVTYIYSNKYKVSPVSDPLMSMIMGTFIIRREMSERNSYWVNRKQ